MNKESWLSTCKKTIQTFVERSTRLQSDTLEIAQEEYIEFNFQTHLTLTFDVQTDSHEQAGRVNSNDNTKVFFNRLEYIQALKTETRAILSRTETLREARALVLSHAYGHINRETTIYTHPKHICLTDNCSNCHGHGQVSCSGCGGSGTNICSSCGGSGQIMERRSYYDNYSKQTRYENYYRSCGCSGGRVRCRSCGGSGSQTCSPCKGSGEITKITQLHSVAIPEYQVVYFSRDVPQFIKDGLYKTGIAHLGRVGYLELQTDSVNDTACQLDFRYDATVPFARFTSPLPNADHHEIKWIVYGFSPHILDAGHVIELMLKNDLNQLVYKASTIKLFNPFIACTSRRTLKTFMESEAHQDMLEANRKGKSGEMLRETLNRGFTTTYLDEALTSLSRIVTAIQRWSAIKWSVLGALLIYCLMPVYMAFNHAWQKDVDRIYMTPWSDLSTSQDALSSLQYLALTSGTFILPLAMVIPLVGYVWRRLWIRYRLGNTIFQWSQTKGILRKKWFKSFLLTSLFTFAILLICPLWADHDGMLFGKIPVLDQVKWILDKLNY